MRMFVLISVLAFACVVGACDKPEERANALFVEAAQALSAAQAETDPLKQYDRLVAANQTITRIVTEFPGSSAAVRISANEPVGPYTKAALAEALAKVAAMPELCLVNLTRACLIDTLAGQVSEFYATPPKEDPRPAIQQATTQLSVLHLLDPKRAATLDPSDPKLKDARGFILEQGYSNTATFASLFNAFASLPGTDAAKEMGKAMRAIPSVSKSHLNILTSAIHQYPTTGRTEQTFKDILRLAAILQNPLPADAEKTITYAFCNFPYFPKKEEIARILADCTPAQLSLGNNLPPLTNAQYEAIYAAAQDEDKKKSIASSAYGRKGATVDDKLLWTARTNGYARIDFVAQLYRLAVREKHPSLPRVIALLEKTPQPDSASPIAKSGVTTKNLMLLHARGQLAEQLPAVIQVLRANPSYSYELEAALGDLVGLATIDPSISKEAVIGTLVATAKTWPADKKANRDYTVYPLLTHILNGDADPKPLYDRYYGTEDYIASAGYLTLKQFKKHGYPQYLEGQLAKAPPLDAERSLLFEVFIEEVKEAASAGDSATVLSKLATLQSGQRISLIRSLFDIKHRERDDGTTRVFPAVLERYPVEVISSEFGWLENYGIPTATKAAIIADHYSEISGPAHIRDGWIMDNAAQLSNDVRLKLIRAMHEANSAHWAVLAAVHLIVNGTQPS